MKISLHLAALTKDVSHMLDGIKYLGKRFCTELRKIDTEDDDVDGAMDQLDLIDEIAALETLFPPNFSVKSGQSGDDIRLDGTNAYLEL